MTPSQAIVDRAGTPQIVVDELGRQLTIRRLTALDTLRLYKAAGATLAQNQPWMGIATLAMSILSIDGIPVPSPITEAQIEAIIGHLGDAGLTAIADALVPSENAEPNGTADMSGNSPGILR